MKMKLINTESGVYEVKSIKGSKWVEVILNGRIEAKVVNLEEARRVIWLMLDDPEIEFVSDSMFVEVHSE